MVAAVVDPLSKGKLSEERHAVKASSLPPIHEKNGALNLVDFDLPSLNTTGASLATPTAAVASTVHKEDHWFKTFIEKYADIITDKAGKLLEKLDTPMFKGSEFLTNIPFSDRLKSNGITPGEIVRYGGSSLLGFLEGFISAERLKGAKLLEGLRRPQPDMDDPPKKPRENR